MRFFFFGLLRDLDVLEMVIGRPAPGQPFPPARLPGFRLARLRRETYPMLVLTPGRVVDGVLVEGLSEADLERIRFFESVEYEPMTVRVETAAGSTLDAFAFAATARGVPELEDWRFEGWRARHKDAELRTTGLWMSLFGVLDVVEADRLWEDARRRGQPVEDLVDEILARRPSVASRR